MTIMQPFEGVFPAKVLRELRQELINFRLEYKFGMEELRTKIDILREEFEHSQSHSPIEHVRTRLKSMESVLNKMVRLGCEPTLESIRSNIRDIAGVRVVCGFTSDVYWIARMLSEQPDIQVVEVKDYVENPKPNGYKSLHLIVNVPVYLSNRRVDVYVELQIRTIAMDFWASLEHQIYYKFDQQVPENIHSELRDAALIAGQLDAKMARLRDEVHGQPKQ